VNALRDKHTYMQTSQTKAILRNQSHVGKGQCTPGLKSKEARNNILT